MCEFQVSIQPYPLVSMWSSNYGEPCGALGSTLVKWEWHAGMCVRCPADSLCKHRSEGGQDLSCSLGLHPEFVFGVLCPSAAGFQAAIVKWSHKLLLWNDPSLFCEGVLLLLLIKS